MRFVSLHEYLHLFLPEGNELHHGAVVPSHAMGSIPFFKSVDKAHSSVLIASPSKKQPCCSEVSLEQRFFLKNKPETDAEEFAFSMQCWFC